MQSQSQNWAEHGGWLFLKQQTAVRQQNKTRKGKIIKVFPHLRYCDRFSLAGWGVQEKVGSPRKTGLYGGSHSLDPPLKKTVRTQVQVSV